MMARFRFPGRNQGEIRRGEGDPARLIAALTAPAL
jgi:hypothetical protein